MTCPNLFNLLLLAYSCFPFVLAQLSSCPGLSIDYLPPRILPGFSLTKIADGYKFPRQIAIDNVGNLVIASLGDGIIGISGDYDSNGCPFVKQKKVIVPDNGNNFTHAVIFSPDDRTLLASTPNFVYAWNYDANTMSVTSAVRVIVKGMNVPPPSMPATHPLAIPKECPNTLLVFRGESMMPDASIYNTAAGLYFDWTKAPPGGYDFTTGGVFATDIRASLDFSEDGYGIFWGLDNGIDGDFNGSGVPVGLPGSFNPADELNGLGPFCPGQTPMNFGYPDFHPVWDPATLPNNPSNLQISQLFSTNASVSDATCQKVTNAPRLSIAPHSAPLGLRFYNPAQTSLGEHLRGSAFSTYHGPAGHKIVIAPFNNGDASAPPSSPQGVLGFIWTDVSINKTNCRSARNNGPTSVGCIAPVGLAVASGGASFWTSDATGEVFAVTKTKTS